MRFMLSERAKGWVIVVAIVLLVVQCNRYTNSFTGITSGHVWYIYDIDYNTAVNNSRNELDKYAQGNILGMHDDTKAKRKPQSIIAFNDGAIYVNGVKYASFTDNGDGHLTLRIGKAEYLASYKTYDDGRWVEVYVGDRMLWSLARSIYKNGAPTYYVDGTMIGDDK